jgi:WD40 repeat protein
MKPRNSTGKKAEPTACAYSQDGNLIVCGCDDGSIMAWDSRKAFVNTSLLGRQCHMNNNFISSIVFSYDNKTIATRGGLYKITHFKITYLNMIYLHRY